MRFTLLSLFVAPLVAAVPLITIIIDDNAISPNVLIIDNNAQKDLICLPPGADCLVDNNECCSQQCMPYTDIWGTCLV
ncbi:hypothetical protein J3A83DRAFT_4205807, partial [Scleroderma citrinum]